MLSHDQLRAFYRDGYVVVRQALPPEVTTAALAVVNAWIGEAVLRGLTEAERGKMRGGVRQCRAYARDPAITALLRHPACRAVVDQLLGEGNVLPFDEEPQVINWYPTRDPGPPWGEVHVDQPYEFGQGPARPGDPAYPMPGFTLNVGVALTDADSENAGNLVVYPGSHRSYAEYCARYGTSLAGLGHRLPPVPLADPVQVLQSTGDLVLLHSQLGHTVAPNNHWHIRTAVYFRLTHRQHRSLGNQVNVRIWDCYPGVTDLVADAAGGQGAPL